jgi:inorganic pyrophosphatase
MNLLHSIKALNSDNSVNAIIEVPNGSKEKTEYNIVDEKFMVSRVLNSGLSFPFNYGFVPETWSTDNDPLDVMVLSSDILPSGSQIKVRVVGLLATTDQEGKDSKLITVPITEKDPLYSNIQDIDSLDKKSLENIEYFYKNYKINEPGKWVDIDGYLTKDEAIIKLNEAIERYHQHFQS